MSFAKYVGLETAFRATFNWYEPSFTIEVGGRSFIVYHAKHPIEPNPNLVIIEANENTKEIYFRAFPGKHSGECDTEAEAEPFFEQVRKTVDPKFRVQGKKLEEVLRRTVIELEEGRFSY